MKVMVNGWMVGEREEWRREGKGRKVEAMNERPVAGIHALQFCLNL